MYNTVIEFFNGLIHSTETQVWFAVILTVLGGGIAALLAYLKTICTNC